VFGPNKGPYFFLLVVGGVVKNQIDLTRIVGAYDSLQETDKRLRVEDRIHPIGETAGEQVDRSEHFAAFASSRGGNLRLRGYLRPSLVEGWVFAEGGFIFEEDRGSLAPGVFFSCGNV